MMRQNLISIDLVLLARLATLRDSYTEACLQGSGC